MSASIISPFSLIIFGAFTSGVIEPPVQIVRVGGIDTSRRNGGVKILIQKYREASRSPLR
jgi:hypothetical protein